MLVEAIVIMLEIFIFGEIYPCMKKKRRIILMKVKISATVHP